jgi:hypothetical protein
MTPLSNQQLTSVADDACKGQIRQANEARILAAAERVFAGAGFGGATMAAIARIGAPVVSLTGLVGPVATIFLAALFLDEPITLLQLAGTGLVMAGIFIISRRKA